MEQMDSTVIATSLPAIAADLGVNPIALKLALTAYLVSVAIFIPISGWLADRFGAKRIFCIAIGIFMTGSICCAIANSLPAFVGARFLQGLGGALMSPIARLMLVRLTAKQDLVGAMAWLAAPALIGPLAGPPIGGFITTYLSWHWIFLVNVPIGIAGVFAVVRLLPEPERAPTGPVDYTGFMLAAFAASGVVFGLSVVSLPALPPIAGIVALLAGIGAAGLYVLHARRHQAPLLDLKLFRTPSFSAAVWGSSLFRVGAGAVPFLLPLLFQLGFGMSPFESGLITFASALGAIGMKFLATFILRFAGFRTVLVGGAALGALLIIVNGWFSPAIPLPLIFAVLVGAGFTRSLFFGAGNALLFAETPSEKAAQVTVIGAVAQQVSIAIGVAIAGGVLEAVTLATGEPVGLESFRLSFLIVGAIAGLAVIPFLRMDPGAGAGVSGHRIHSAGSGGRSPVELP